MHNFRVYWISLYMFRTVSPSIIRSSRLYTQHQLYVIQVSWLLTSRHETGRVIQVIITNDTAPLATIVAVTSLITLHYYLKISYPRFIILNTEPKWNLKSHKNKITKRIIALILSSRPILCLLASSQLTCMAYNWCCQIKHPTRCNKQS